jgi:hypothetical protein
MLARTAASLAALCLGLGGGSVFAQQPTGGKSLNFHKDAKITGITTDTGSSTFVPAQPVPLVPPSGIQQTTMMQDKVKAADPRGQDLTDQQSDAYNVQLEPPGPHRLFRLESERSLQERMRQEALQRPNPERINFPDEPDVSRGETWKPREFPPVTEVAEACYLCYNRLWFEERNSERYGWDLGFIQPFISAGAFYADLALLPYHWGTDPCRCYDCNTGYCLPGDPVPYVLYPPGLSVKGLVAEGVAWVGIAALFP